MALNQAKLVVQCPECRAETLVMVPESRKGELVTKCIQCKKILAVKYKTETTIKVKVVEFDED